MHSLIISPSYKTFCLTLIFQHFHAKPGQQRKQSFLLMLFVKWKHQGSPINHLSEERMELRNEVNGGINRIISGEKAIYSCTGRWVRTRGFWYNSHLIGCISQGLDPTRLTHFSGKNFEFFSSVNKNLIPDFFPV